MAAINPKVEVSEDAIRSFCQRCNIREFALICSILRDDFRPDSDVDVLVSFAPDSKGSLGDIIISWELIPLTTLTRLFLGVVFQRSHPS